MMRTFIRLLTVISFLAVLPFWQAEASQVSFARYISLAPSTTEILFALGLDEEIVGVSSYCDFPPEALTRERIGDFSRPNLEKICALKPDYIFCTGLEQAPVIAQLRAFKLKVYIADPKNIAELLDSIRSIGSLVDRETEAAALIRSMERRIDKVKLSVSGIPATQQARVFVEIWHEPLMTAGKGSFVDELISCAGGINIAWDTKRPYSIFSSEAVIAANPDCIILAYMGEENPLDFVRARLGWNGLNAVRQGRVSNDIPPDLLLRPGPRIVLGIEQLYHAFYPDTTKIRGGMQHTQVSDEG
jgi:iron complex transport system substrate-binding protein